MPIQRVSRANIEVADDEAFLLTTSCAGADHWVALLSEWWLMSVDPDGTCTLVFAHEDP